MKKLVLLSLAVVTAVALGGCGDKQKVTEKDLETISEKQVEQAFEKMENQDSKKTKAKGETQKETESEKVDLNELGVSIAIDDPYEMKNLFEIFGLDNDFPKPNENFGIESSYSTAGFPVDNITGEKKEGIKSYHLQYGKDQNYYQEYKQQVLDYVKEKKPDVRPNANKNAGYNPVYIYKIDENYYGTVHNRDSDASFGLKGVAIEKIAYESLTATTSSETDKSSSRIKSWTRTKDGNEIKWQYIRATDQNDDFYEFQYSSDICPDLPFDIDPTKKVIVDFDMIPGHTKIYYINKISIE